MWCRRNSCRTWKMNRKRKCTWKIFALALKVPFNTSPPTPHNVILNLFRQLTLTIDTFSQQEILNWSNPILFAFTQVSGQFQHLLKIDRSPSQILSVCRVTNVEHLAVSAWINSVYNVNDTKETTLETNWRLALRKISVANLADDVNETKEILHCCAPD